MYNIRRAHDRIDTSLRIQLGSVLRRHDELYVIGVLVDCLLLELAHAADESLHTVRPVDDAIRFIEIV